MKRGIIILYINVVGLFLFSCKNENKPLNAEVYPKVKIMEKVHDFGTIKREDTVSYAFEILNSSKKSRKAYFISDVSASCGCTDLKFTEDSIAVNKKGIIDVTYTPKTNDSGFVEKIIVVADNSKDRFQTFYLRGKVIDN